MNGYNANVVTLDEAQESFLLETGQHPRYYRRQHNFPYDITCWDDILKDE